ncbi:response regulator [Spirochaeta africana]|uniref:CheY-like receiver domain-containing protein n=1 Tax=Spirochaeta africana (strain ATCC 700263 / DSM 8902 / Z-7692) TaxID=889378 RepID=H9UFN2_SPIAZ|nr:response regulator [Spirochaeta africana]AFG36325.1 CheY-like receiver domain-containing protein [Spirochaeta africana DSM 8902]
MKRVLIVEDDPVGKVVMQRMLETDFSCDVAETAEEAMGLVQQTRYAGLVLDINLGDDSIDGCRLLARIRQLDGYQEIPAVATTAYAMNGDRERFLDSGFNAYVSKPVRISELLETMHRVFG